ncbi:MAG: hypothetical protein IIA92_02060 [Chloroflexi bacterium]|nr:hypothetical protein [Chloroflexota bacterium]
MPGDLVWVALITSAAVLASAWLTARFTDKSAQRQIDAQVETTKAQTAAQAEITRKQLESQEAEARRDRVISARKGHLAIVQETLSDYVVAHKGLTVNIEAIDFPMYQSLALDSPMRTLHEQNILERFGEVTQLGNSVLAIMTQINDATLYRLIAEITGDLIGEFRPRSDTPSFETVTAMFKENQVDPIALNCKVMEVNKRIEELMSGVELSSG